MNAPQIINDDAASVGEMGQQYLACGKKVAMRLWQEPAGDQCESRSRDYEIVGYVVSGEVEIRFGKEVATLKSGDSWLIPPGTSHRFKILQDLVAVEATSPPARLGGKDEE
ncbi:cupin domain-containing protein [Planctomycetes bacterium K23_9]|uniref:Cupin domain protein n=1 Tax=Stieleria marina TaxID=1930275 RepID=A0A517NXW5_9BACT|nr:Cupin domain protein [Planctomycetes bacterium K23_9]